MELVNILSPDANNENKCTFTIKGCDESMAVPNQELIKIQTTGCVHNRLGDSQQNAQVDEKTFLQKLAMALSFAWLPKIWMVIFEYLNNNHADHVDIDKVGLADPQIQEEKQQFVNNNN